MLNNYSKQSRKMSIFSCLLGLLLGSLFSSGAHAFDYDELKFSADVYGAHTHLVTYKGYQDDINVAFRLKYPDFRLQPFVRYSDSHYYFLNESIPGNTDYSTEYRTSLGAGLDLFLIMPYLRIRYIAENITNKITDTKSDREAYILIYNQYIDLEAFQLNNYLESSVVPKLSTEKLNTYFRIQALKTIDLSRTVDSSNVIFPFIQVKARDNEELLFGASGNQGSVGLGFKNYTRISSKSNIAFLLEANTLLYQSREFNADWNQLLAVVQYNYN